MSEQKTEEKEKKRQLLIILLIIGMVICIGITVWALFFRDSTGTATPDYPPQGVEVNQNPIEDDNSGKLDSPAGGGAINVTYGTAATASLSEKKITFYYANPNASNQNVSVLITVDNLLVAKSDLINPGNEVTSLELEEKAVELLETNKMYNAELTVRAYDPDSGEKAMVDTKGEITLTVTE